MLKKLISKILGKKEKTAPGPAAPSPPPSTEAARPGPGGERRRHEGGRPAGSRPAGSRPAGSQGRREAQSPRDAGRRGSGRHGTPPAGDRARPREQRRGPSEGRRPHAPETRSWTEFPPDPPWTPPDDPAYFANYDLPEEVRKGIDDAGFSTCTPVQAKTLPLTLQGKDAAAQSQTGTGKTAAYLITIYARLLRRGPTGRPGPRSLVIAPTRELVVQIEQDARLLGRHTGLSTVAIYGGVDYDKQRRALAEGPTLLVGTPGRVIDYMKQGIWRPEGIEILVIDECDRLFDLGFIQDLRFILRRLPPYEHRQSMLFSATLSYRVLELTYEYMNLPQQIIANPEQITAEKAEEVLYHVSREEKAALFLGLIKKDDWTRTMVFTNMKVEAEKVARLLERNGYEARAITGNLEQPKRLKVMDDFKKGRLPFLVATDVASRGLHIEGVSHVVNWDLPQDPEDYVHRIGRTARAGASGKALTLADEHTVLYLEAIEKLIGYKIPVVWHGAEDLAEVKPGWEREPYSSGGEERRRRHEGRPNRPAGQQGRQGRQGGGRDEGRRGSASGGGRRPPGRGSRPPGQGRASAPGERRGHPKAGSEPGASGRS